MKVNYSLRLRIDCCASEMPCQIGRASFVQFCAPLQANADTDVSIDDDPVNNYSRRGFLSVFSCRGRGAEEFRGFTFRNFQKPNPSSLKRTPDRIPDYHWLWSNRLLMELVRREWIRLLGRLAVHCSSGRPSADGSFHLPFLHGQIRPAMTAMSVATYGIMSRIDADNFTPII